MSFRVWAMLVMPSVLVVLASSLLLANDISVNDLIAGVKSSREKTVNYDATYLVQINNHDEFDEYWRDVQARQKAEGLPVEEPSVRQGFTFERTSRTLVRCLKTEDQLAFYFLSPDDPATVLSASVFDGQVLQFLDSDGVSLKRALPGDASRYYWRLMEDFLLLESRSIDEYLGLDGVSVHIAGTRRSGDAVLLQATASREIGADSSMRMSVDYEIEFDLTKDFLPVSIKRFNGYSDAKSGKTVRLLQEETRVDSTGFSNGVYYPSSISSKYYKHIVQSESPISTKQYYVTDRQVTISKFQANIKIDSSKFKIEDIPKGGTVIDDVNESIYQVVPKGGVQALSQEMKDSQATVSIPLNPGDGRSAGGPLPSASSSDKSNRFWLIVIATICLVLGSICARIIIRKQHAAQ